MDAHIKKSAIIFSVFLTASTYCSIAHSAILSFEFNDPVGDATREHGTDVTRILTIFDNTTGFYTTTLFTVLGKPFEDRFTINLNMANPDTDEYTEEQSYFFDNLNEFTNHPVSTAVELAGFDSSLLYWNVGDRVVLSSEPFGIPSSSASHTFSSGMTDYSTFWEASSDAFPLNDIATIQAVPIPASIWLFSTGLIGLIGVARQKKMSQ